MTQIHGKSIGATGYGLMGLTWRDNPCSTEQAFGAMKAALNGGANFWDGGEFYGPPTRNSLHLLNEYFTKYPEDAEKVFLCVKGNLGAHGPDCSAAQTRTTLDNILKLLDGKKSLDSYEPARQDKKTPVKETMEALNEYVKAGKLGGISLSEVGEKTIREAAKYVKIDSVQVEFSLFSTDILYNGVAKACAELGIPIIGYSPFSRGFLTGKVKDRMDLEPMIRDYPRFRPDIFEHNLKLVAEIEHIATSKKCTPGQIALAWVKTFSGKEGMPVIIPIPGATSEARVKENTIDVTLSKDDMVAINEALKKCEVKGGRYPDGLAQLEFA